MDKYEYRVKTEQMLQYAEEKSYKKAMEIADTIDWRKVRNTTMLTTVSEIYENMDELEKARNIMFIAYEKAPTIRKTVYRMGLLSIKLGYLEEAVDCYEEFTKMAPKDPNQYLLKYKILREQKAPIGQQIEALEEFKHAEYVEKWAFELAKLYHEAGMTAECLEECDDLILWFSEGKYVYQAMELKMKYKPLTPLQQEKYDKRNRINMAEEPVKKKPMFKKPKERPAPDPRIAQKIRENVHVTGTIDLPELPEPTRDLEIPDLESLPDETPKRPRTKIENTSDIVTTISGDNLMDVLKTGVAVASGVEVSGEEPVPQVTGQMRIEEILANWEATQRANAEIIEKNQEEINRKKEEAAIAKKKEEKKSEKILTDDIRQLMEDIENDVDFSLPVNDVDEYEEEEPEEVDEDFENMGDVVSSLMMLDEEESEDYIEEEEDLAEEEELTEENDFAEEDEYTEEDDFAEEEELTEEDSFAEEDEYTEEDEYEEDEYTEEEESAEAELTEEDEYAEKVISDEYEEATLEEIEETDEVEEEKNPEEEGELEEIGKDEEEEKERSEELDKDKELDNSEDIEIEVEDFRDEDDEVDSWEIRAVEIIEAQLDTMKEVNTDIEFDPDEFIEPIEYDDVEEDEYEEDEYEEDEYEEDEYEEDEYEEDEYEEDEYEEDEYEEDEYEEDEYEEDEYEEDEYEEDEYEEDEYEEDEYEEDEYEEDECEEDEYKADEDKLELEIENPSLEIEKNSEEQVQDRLKKFDTGFVVQGRYDLSATSEIGLKAGLTEEQKKLFSYFVPIRGVSEQIVEVLDNDKRCRNRYGTSRIGNIVVIGRQGTGKTVMAVDLVKAIQKQRNLKQGKVAIVTGESLNKKDVESVVEKLYGGALIIEKASKMSNKTIQKLNDLMESQTGELLFILEEQKKPLERMFAAHPEFKEKFTSRMELPVFINDELVTFGQTYAKENGYKIDEMGILALYSRIDMMQREDHAVTVAEVKEIMDEAIERSRKNGMKHLVKKMFGKNKDENNRILLREEDFKI